ncbi:hypothetical protein AB0D04_09700 [Streptomyces sp. NPDC048483]|uniref:HEAT repeat domain-containing protein n=1 Tax=Streptomyces sp. NPDC048483 TaxID=3154927 RepID=UPI003436A8ED
MSVRPPRLAALLAAPSNIDFMDERDLRLLAKVTEEDRAELRAGALSGGTWPGFRVKAVVALVRLRDGAARDLLAAVLADQECLQVALSNIEYVGDGFGDHEELITPWLLGLLDSDDRYLRRCAALACERLGVAAAGPRLLELAQAGLADLRVGREEYVGDPLIFLTAAARIWPGREVAQEVRRWLDRPGAKNRTECWPGKPLRLIAERAEPGVYEEALQRCAEEVLSGAANSTVKGLLSRGQEGLPLLDRAVREAPDHAAGRALEALAKLDPDRAAHYALEDWRRFPESAMAVLGEVFREKAAHPEVVDLVVRISDECRPWLDTECVEALVNIGGPDAVAAARGVVERFAARDSYDSRLTKLQNLVANDAPAPPKDVAAQLVGLGLVPADAADAALARCTAPASAYTVLEEALDQARLVARFSPDSGCEPPPYDNMVTDFVDAADGSLNVEETDLTETPDGPRLSFTLHGRPHSLTAMDECGEYWDLGTVYGIAKTLSPGDGDPREFVEIDQLTWAFVDPDKLARFCEHHNVKVYGH